MLRKKDGMTMVEVIVAFTVLMLCVAMVTTCVSLAGNVQHHAAEQRQNMVNLEEKLYGNDTSGVTVTAEPEEIWEFSSETRSDLTFRVKVTRQSAQAEGYTIDTYHAAG